MKSLLRIIALGLLTFMMFSLTDCSNKRDGDDKTVAIEADRDEIRKDLKELGAEIDQRLEKIEDRLKIASGDAKVQLEKAKLKLTDDRSNINRSLDQVEKATENTWSDVKTSARKTGQDVRQAFQKIGNELSEVFDNGDTE